MANNSGNQPPGSGYGVGNPPPTPSAKKSFNLASKAKALGSALGKGALAAGAAVLGVAGWLAKNAFSKKGAFVALAVLPFLGGIYKMSDPYINPTPDQPTTEESAQAFFQGAGAVYAWEYRTARDIVLYPFKKAHEWGLIESDRNTFTDPQYITVCHPQHRYTITPPTGVNIDPATRKASLDSQAYYDSMDAKIGEIIANPDHQIYESMSYGWHPVIKYQSPYSYDLGKIDIDYANNPSQQHCGSNAFRPVNIPVSTPSS